MENKLAYRTPWDFDDAASPPAARVVGINELDELVGLELHGDRFTLHRANQELFERATWLDRAYPDPSPPEFPEQTVEGFFNLALLDALAIRTLRFDPETSYALNYGLDRVRFVAPIMLGDVVDARFVILAVKPKHNGRLLLRRCEMHVEGHTRPALIADWWVCVLPRAGA